MRTASDGPVDPKAALRLLKEGPIWDSFTSSFKDSFKDSFKASFMGFRALGASRVWC